MELIRVCSKMPYYDAFKGDYTFILKDIHYYTDGSIIPPESRAWLSKYVENGFTKYYPIFTSNFFILEFICKECQEVTMYVARKENTRTMNWYKTKIGQYFMISYYDSKK